jgi:tetratricopeptide (TPR) repeat protein
MPILTESLQLQPQTQDRSRVDTLLELGRAQIGAGKLAHAEEPLQEALHLAQNNFGAASLESGHALWELGMLRLQQGQNAEAKDLYIRSLRILEASNAQQADVSAVLDDLATVYTREQQWALAKQTYERSLDIDRRVLGEDHPRVARRFNNLAIVAQNMGDLARAERLYRESIRLHERTYGERHPETAAVKGNLGLLLQREGRLAEAEPLLRGALDAKISAYGPDNYKVGYTRVSLAMLLHDQGNLAAAEGEFRQALAIYDKSLPANHLYRASALMYLARLLVDMGKSDEALALSEQSLRILTAILPASSAPTAQAHAIHAYALTRLGSGPEAADELAAAVPVLLSARGPDDPVVRRAQDWLKAVRPAALQTASTAP